MGTIDEGTWRAVLLFKFLRQFPSPNDGGKIELGQIQLGIDFIALGVFYLGNQFTNWELEKKKEKQPLKCPARNREVRQTVP